MRVVENEIFRTKRGRNRRFKEKNSVICPILESIKVVRPASWTAILMPCLHGPELAILKNKKVPNRNLWAIERDPQTWRDIKRTLGLNVGPEPLEASEAVEHIAAECENGFDLIYLDFFSRPNFSHLRMLQKIFTFRMLKPGAKLVLTFGKGRCRPEVQELNDMLLGKGEVLPTKTEVLAAAELSKHRPPKWMRNHQYRSIAGGNRVIHYVTTEAQF